MGLVARTESELESNQLGFPTLCGKGNNGFISPKRTFVCSHRDWFYLVLPSFTEFVGPIL